MKSPAALAAALCLAPMLAAATPSTPAKKPESPWVFSILPKSLQQNPLLDLTVITELTDAGKKLAPASPAAPAYFLLQSSGYRQLGDAAANEKTLPPEDLERTLLHSLAASGYLPAPAAAPGAVAAHPPTLVIFYSWGAHSLLVEADPENPSVSASRIARNVLDRAAMVGGEKFARELQRLFEQADSQAVLNRTVPADPSGEVPSIAPILAASTMAFTNPVNLFKMKSAKNEFLVEQSADDCYFVVASAYDYAAMAGHKQRVLLWRTRMTVNARGVSQPQTLPTLIAAAAPYFGKEMAEPEILTRRPVKEGRVEIGDAKVVEPAKK